MNGSETGFRHPGSETETAGRARSGGWGVSHCGLDRSLVIRHTDPARNCILKTKPSPIGEGFHVSYYAVLILLLERPRSQQEPSCGRALLSLGLNRSGT